MIKPGPSKASSPRLGRRRAQWRAMRAASKPVCRCPRRPSPVRIIIFLLNLLGSCGFRRCLRAWRLLHLGASLRRGRWRDDAWMILSIRHCSISTDMRSASRCRAANTGAGVRKGPVYRRHQPSGPSLLRDRAQPLCARDHPGHRHRQRRIACRGCSASLARRIWRQGRRPAAAAAGHEQPRRDADAEPHPGCAGDRQGPLCR